MEQVKEIIESIAVEILQRAIGEFTSEWYVFNDFLRFILWGVLFKGELSKFMFPPP